MALCGFAGSGGGRGAASVTPELGVAVAFAAGVFSFLSPCVLPLVPSYASFLTGMTFDELTVENGMARWSVLAHGALFVAGFSLVFIALGASASYVGAVLRVHGVWLERVGGVLLVVFGLHMLGGMRVPGLDRERRFYLSRKPVGYAGSVTAGVAFGAGWTPCIGPVLGGILTLAATGDGVADGIRLLSAYSAGLAVPFLAASVLLSRFLDTRGRFRRLMPLVNRVGGALLVLMGLLLLTGSFTVLAGLVARWTPEFLLERI